MNKNYVKKIRNSIIALLLTTSTLVGNIGLVFAEDISSVAESTDIVENDENEVLNNDTEDDEVADSNEGNDSSENEATNNKNVSEDKGITEDTTSETVETTDNEQIDIDPEIQTLDETSDTQEVNDSFNLEIWRNTWSGKNLGTTITDEQLAEIDSGELTTIGLGDYWVLKSKNGFTNKYLVVDYDYYYGKNGNSIHDLCVVVDGSGIQMDNSLIKTDTGYYNSALRKYINNNILTNNYVSDEIKLHLLSRYEYESVDNNNTWELKLNEYGVSLLSVAQLLGEDYITQASAVTGITENDGYISSKEDKQLAAYKFNNNGEKIDPTDYEHRLSSYSDKALSSITNDGYFSCIDANEITSDEKGFNTSKALTNFKDSTIFSTAATKLSLSLLFTISKPQNNFYTSISDWEYEIKSDKNGEFVVLKTYTGKQTAYKIPSTATINGKTYKVALSLYEDSPKKPALNTGTIQDLSVEEGVYIGNMYQLFYNNTTIQNLDLTGADTSSVKIFAQCFLSMTNLKNLTWHNADLSNGTTIAYLFHGNTNLKKVDMTGSTFGAGLVSAVFTYGTEIILKDCTFLSSSLQYFAPGTKAKTFDLSGSSFPNVTDLTGMFSGSRVLTSVDLSNAKFPLLTNISNAFISCQNLTTVNFDNADLSSCTNFASMFMNDSKLTNIDLSKTKLSKNVVNMQGMFQSCKEIKTINLGEMGFDTAEIVTNYGLTFMFLQCEQLKYIFVDDNIDLSGEELKKVSSSMFYKDAKLPNYDENDNDNSTSTFNTHAHTGDGGYFSNYLIAFDNNVNRIDDVTGTMDIQSCAFGEGNLKLNAFTSESKTFLGWNTKPDGTGTFFEDGADISSIKADIGETITLYAQWKLSEDHSEWLNDWEYEVRTQDYSEEEARYVLLKKYIGNEKAYKVPAYSQINSAEYRTALSVETTTAIDFGVIEELDFEEDVVSLFTSKIFADNKNLKTIKHLGYVFDYTDRTWKYDSTSKLFSGCTSLTSVDLDWVWTLDDYIVYFSNMFEGCESLTSINLTLTKYGDKKARYLSGMFKNCTNLQNVSVSVDDGTDMRHMFENCENLKEVKLYGSYASSDCSRMFYNCKKLEALNLENVSNSQSINNVYNEMFSGCSNLEEILVNNDWATYKDYVYKSVSKNSKDMFKDCVKLPNFDAGVVDYTHAKAGTPHYFTQYWLRLCTGTVGDKIYYDTCYEKVNLAFDQEYTISNAPTIRGKTFTNLWKLDGVTTDAKEKYHIGDDTVLGGVGSSTAIINDNTTVSNLTNKLGAYLAAYAYYSVDNISFSISLKTNGNMADATEAFTIETTLTSPDGKVETVTKTIANDETVNIGDYQIGTTFGIKLIDNEDGYTIGNNTGTITENTNTVNITATRNFAVPTNVNKSNIILIIGGVLSVLAMLTFVAKRQKDTVQDN